MKAVSLILAPFGIFGVIWLEATVIKDLWAWFLVPLFHVPVIGAAQALGLSLVTVSLGQVQSCANNKNLLRDTVLTALLRWALGFATAKYLGLV